METVLVKDRNCLTRPLSGRPTFNDDDRWAAVHSLLFLINMCEGLTEKTEPKVAEHKAGVTRGEGRIAWRGSRFGSKCRI